MPILPARGLIYDRNGVPLVENQASFAAAVVAADIPDINSVHVAGSLPADHRSRCKR